MAGLGKLVKQAEKMKRGIEALQTQLEAKEIEVTTGGGAVKIKVSGSGKFLSLTLDPEFLKEDPKLVADTISRPCRMPPSRRRISTRRRCRKSRAPSRCPGCSKLLRRSA
jgi:DNA-binding protein YbaB